MKGYMKMVHKHNRVAYAGILPQGLAVVHLNRKLAPSDIEAAAKSLGLRVSSHPPKRSKRVDVRDSKGSLAATVVGNDLVLLPAHQKNQELAKDFVNALLKRKR
ncbi:hypothetical protein COT29_01000 [Candidatus Micrarchaeota archaeon CG08_land_8_20_14_0_20_59_11]|nr:MAG: hypothetical protein COT29_01000 [Candidatus Micrarchaeota archaeon CG08_land_8_20_14_0_20_59_11]PIT85282.1 MAG: hypothetical protein COU36_04155 [Candidatus Micrarchaeota archaeon CG10_big_fil_rev_8_21_14_0_10_59_7]